MKGKIVDLREFELRHRFNSVWYKISFSEGSK